MAQQVINIGASPNDGTGDQLRTAFEKCNDNFTELYASSGAVDSVNGQTGVVVLDATDVDALQRDGSNANSDIDIDTFSFNAKSIHAKGTAGAGHLGLKHQSANPTASGQETVIFAGSDGEPRYKNDGGAIEQFAPRTWVSAQGFITNVISALGYTPLPTQAGSTTGTVVTFETDRVYGTIASPETGNITADVTGAQVGVTNIIIHNSGTAPTFGSQFKKLSGSGNYITSQVNYIYCTFINSTEIIYSINQRT